MAMRNLLLAAGLLVLAASGCTRDPQAAYDRAVAALAPADGAPPDQERARREIENAINWADPVEQRTLLSDALLIKGDILMDGGMHLRAITTLERARLLAPDSRVVTVALGRALFGVADYDAALREFESKEGPTPSLLRWIASSHFRRAQASRRSLAEMYREILPRTEMPAALELLDAAIYLPTTDLRQVSARADLFRWTRMMEASDASEAQSLLVQSQADAQKAEHQGTLALMGSPNPVTLTEALELLTMAGRREEAEALVRAGLLWPKARSSVGLQMAYARFLKRTNRSRDGAAALSAYVTASKGRRPELLRLWCDLALESGDASLYGPAVVAHEQLLRRGDRWRLPHLYLAGWGARLDGDSDLALDHLGTFLRDGGGRIMVEEGQHARAMLVDLYLESGESERAAEALEEILSESPGSVQHRARLAGLQWKVLDRPYDAAGHYLFLVQHDPLRSELWVERWRSAIYEHADTGRGSGGGKALADLLDGVDEALETGDSEQALVLAQRLYRARPNLPFLQVLLARVYRARGDAEDAGRLLKAHLRDYPDNVEAQRLAVALPPDHVPPEAVLLRMRSDPDGYGRAIRGRALMDAGDLKAAERVVLGRASGPPPSGESLRLLAAIERRRGNLDAAIDALAAVDPRGDEEAVVAAERATLFLENQQVQEAVSVLTRVSGGSVMPPDLVRDAAVALLAERHTADARQLLGTLPAGDPETERILAACDRQDGLTASQVGLLDRAFGREGGQTAGLDLLLTLPDRDSRERLADLVLPGLPPELALAAALCCRLQPEDEGLEALEPLTRLLLEQLGTGRFEQATDQERAASKEFFRVLTNNRAPDGALGRFLLMQQLPTWWDRSLAELDRVAGKLPDNPLPAFYRGRIHEASGQVPSALQAYQEALVLEPDFALAMVDVARVRQSRGEDDAAEEALRSHARLRGRTARSDAIQAAVTKGDSAMLSRLLGGLLLESGDVTEIVGTVMQTFLDLRKFDKGADFLGLVLPKLSSDQIYAMREQILSLLAGSRKSDDLSVMAARLLAQHPEDAIAGAFHIESLLMAGQSREALAAAKHLRATDPKWVLRVVNRVGSQNPGWAADWIENALLDTPSHMGLWERQAVFLDRAGRREEALDRLVALLKVDGTPTAAMSAIDLALRSGNIRQAEGLRNRYLDLLSAVPDQDVLLLGARLELAFGHPGNALPLFEAGDTPEFLEGRVQARLLLGTLEDLIGAVKDLRAWIAADADASMPIILEGILRKVGQLKTKGGESGAGT